MSPCALQLCEHSAFLKSLLGILTVKDEFLICPTMSVFFVVIVGLEKVNLRYFGALTNSGSLLRMRSLPFRDSSSNCYFLRYLHGKYCRFFSRIQQQHFQRSRCPRHHHRISVPLLRRPQKLHSMVYVLMLSGMC